MFIYAEREPKILLVFLINNLPFLCKYDTKVILFFIIPKLSIFSKTFFSLKILTSCIDADCKPQKNNKKKFQGTQTIIIACPLGY